MEKHRFEVINGRINLVATTRVWGETIVSYEDVTGEIVSVFNKYMCSQLESKRDEWVNQDVISTDGE